ncbi:MAG: DUF1351 domain-containing protein [Oscillospiraceae bacterium]|nr:DUF1351 domain-containing protein [Oscillospiraceae bacterium]
MNDLILVKQLPVIEEHLQIASAELVRISRECESLVATEDNLATVKRRRAEATKQFQELEQLRKAVKTRVMAPYNAFEETYKALITEVAKNTDRILKEKIDSVELNLLQEKIDEAERFISEYSKASEIPFDLDHRSLGINIIRSRSDKSIRDEVISRIDRIKNEINCISVMEFADEILYEYKRSHNFPEATRIVNERHQSLEALKEPKTDKETDNPQETTDDIHPPVLVDDSTIYTMSFTVRGTKTKLKELKKYLADNNMI